MESAAAKLQHDNQNTRRSARSDSTGATSVRTSNGLAEFCGSLEERPGLAILDFAPASQSTVSFITNYGHKLYSEDFLGQLEEAFGAETLLHLGLDASSKSNDDPSINHSNPLLVSRFFNSAMNFTDESFDGALVWDAFEYLAPPLLQSVVEKMHRILRPGAYVLAVFHAGPSLGETALDPSPPAYHYRIQDSRTLHLTERPARPLAQSFSNRGVEKLFQNFDSVKFFLTRGNVREVIIRK